MIFSFSLQKQKNKKWHLAEWLLLMACTHPRTERVKQSTTIIAYHRLLLSYACMYTLLNESARMLMSKKK
jgi:hypothetical protein